MKLCKTFCKYYRSTEEFICFVYNQWSLLMLLMEPWAFSLMWRLIKHLCITFYIGLCTNIWMLFCYCHIMYKIFISCFVPCEPTIWHWWWEWIYLNWQQGTSNIIIQYKVHFCTSDKFIYCNYFGDINFNEATAIPEPWAQVLSSCCLHCHNCDLKMLYDVPFP